jgi:hypothetical protein
MLNRSTTYAALLLFALAVSMFPRSSEAPTGLLVAVTKWLESAECARSTGAILALCANGKLIPIAAGSPGDDPGHALILGIYAATTGASVTTTTVENLNAAINFTGLATLALLLLSLRLRASALFILLSGPIIASQFNDISPHAAQLGGAGLAAILPIAILNRRSVPWLCTGLLSLALAATFRQSIGLMGLAASIIAICIRLCETRRSVFEYGALAALVVLSYESPTILLHLRDAAYGLSSADLMQRHGIWHNLYIGLGANDNPLGIQWNDTFGFEVANKANPGVGWATAAYYDTMRGEYFKLFAEHPMEVAQIYLGKVDGLLMTQIQNPLGRVRIILWPTLVSIAAMFVISGWKADRRIITIQIVCVLFICFFMGQAVLFHYSMLYLHPIQIFLALAIGVCLDAELKKRVVAHPSSPTISWLRK